MSCDLQKIVQCSCSLFKNVNQHHFINYTPISLLPQVSKILEQIFNPRLETFVEKYKVMNESQSGFRSQRSTSMTIIDATEELSNALENKKPLEYSLM